MFKLSNLDILFIGFIHEGFLYGLYSGIFAIYVRYQASKTDNNKRQNIIFYSICVLYVLSAGLFCSDIIAMPTHKLQVGISIPRDSALRRFCIERILFGCCDFIAQFILIYRCWIVWGCKIRVVIIPSILAFAFLVTWVMSNSSAYISSGQISIPGWANFTTLLGLLLSLTINALVTGLILFRIFKVFREVRTTSHDQILGTTGGGKLRHIIFVLIESGMVLFSIQLARVVATIICGDRDFRSFDILIPIHNMLNGIIPTIILVRTSMGLSFHDEKSMEEVAIGNMSSAFNHPDPVSDTESIGVVVQDSREDGIGIQ